MTDRDDTIPGTDEEFPEAIEHPGAGETAAEDCAGDRTELEPRATADCAGDDLVKEYDNEEDGGS